MQPCLTLRICHVRFCISEGERHPSMRILGDATPEVGLSGIVPRVVAQRAVSQAQTSCVVLGCMGDGMRKMDADLCQQLCNSPGLWYIVLCCMQASQHTCPVWQCKFQPSAYQTFLRRWGQQ